jgi:hypothetical protein
MRRAGDLLFAGGTMRSWAPQTTAPPQSGHDDGSGTSNSRSTGRVGARRCPPVPVAPVVLPPAFDPDAWAPLPADPSRTERLDTCKPAAVLQELLQLGNASVAGRQHLGHLAHPASRRTTTLSVTRVREFEEHLVAIRPRCADLKPRPGVLAGERQGTNSEGRVGVNRSCDLLRG